MILVKKKYLVALVMVCCFLVVFGELKFFMAIQSINVQENLQLKYELENFIFASVVVLLIVFLFFVSFFRTSENIFKRLDKMIELSEYGKHDVSSHLEKLGRIGKKFNYLTYYLNNLNALRALKISSLSNVVDFLVSRSEEALFLTDCQGTILNCTGKFAQELKKEEKDIIGRSLNEFLADEDFGGIFYGLDTKRSAIEKEKLSLKVDEKEKKKRAFFYPVVNSANQISDVIGIIEGGEHFDFFRKK